MNNESAGFTTDRDLISAILEHGDEHAFRLLYRRHTPRLLGFVSRLMPEANPEDEDIVQETWIRACEGLKRFQWRSTFLTWLLGIGLNVIRDHLRRNKSRHMVAGNEVPDKLCQSDVHEVRIDLDRAIQMLPDEYRVVIVLHDIEGFTHREIAEQLEIPIGTAKSQLFRARRMIRECLSDRNGVKR
jgi:RNA polymerase sigma factor (sigma-70 family)